MRCLMMLVLVGLVGQSMGYREFDLKRSNKLELKNLLRVLGDKMPVNEDIWGTKYEHSLDPQAHMVADLLAEAKNKEAEIFNKFTIDQLLAWNEWTVDDCAEVKLEERRKTCSQFCTEDETMKINEFIRNAPKPLKGDEAVPYNLGNYCWYIVRRLEWKCPKARLREAEKKFNGWLSKDAWILSSFNHMLKKYIADNKIPMHRVAANREANYKTAVLEVFDQVVKNKTDKDSFKNLCRVLVGKVGKIIHHEEIGEEIGKDLRDYYSLCMVINETQIVAN